MLILVTGWRYCRSGSFVVSKLEALVNHFALFDEPIEMVHGACHLGGADEYAEAWGVIRAQKVTRFPAQEYGAWPECGPARNQAMVRYFDRHPDLNKWALAFPRLGWKGRPGGGTRNCIETLQLFGHNPIIHEVM